MKYQRVHRYGFSNACKTVRIDIYKTLHSYPKWDTSAVNLGERYMTFNPVLSSNLTVKHVFLSNFNINLLVFNTNEFKRPVFVYWNNTGPNYFEANLLK